MSLHKNLEKHIKTLNLNELEELFNILSSLLISPIYSSDFNEEIKEYDMVVLPGGMPGSVNLRDDERVINLLKEFNSNNKKIAAICAGPISLGKAGLSEGKNVTCYPGFEEQLGNCNYQKELVVIDRNIITGRGPAAAIPFAFEILKQIAPEKVDEIKKAMLF